MVNGRVIMHCKHRSSSPSWGGAAVTIVDGEPAIHLSPDHKPHDLFLNLPYRQLRDMPAGKRRVIAAEEASLMLKRVQALRPRIMQLRTDGLFVVRSLEREIQLLTEGSEEGASCDWDFSLYNNISVAARSEDSDASSDSEGSDTELFETSHQRKSIVLATPLTDDRYQVGKGLIVRGSVDGDEAQKCFWVGIVVRRPHKADRGLSIGVQWYTPARGTAYTGALVKTTTTDSDGKTIPFEQDIAVGSIIVCFSSLTTKSKVPLASLQHAQNWLAAP